MAQKAQFITPVGRLGFNALWEKDSYRDEKTGAESEPKYKADIILDPSETEELWGTIYDEALAHCEMDEDALDKAINAGLFTVPIKDGDEIAAKREAKGKNGDAVKGKEVLRAGTAFNANGDNAPGGIFVVDENNEQIDFDRRNKVYLGCDMKMSITLSFYKTGTSQGVTAYLNGAQFVGDNERIGQDKSNLFKPLAEQKAAPRGRRGRK